MWPRKEKTLEELQEQLKEAVNTLNILISEKEDKTLEVKEYTRYMQSLLSEIKKTYEYEKLKELGDMEN